MNVQLAGVMRVVLNLLRYRDDVRRPTIMADGVCLNPSTGTGVEYEKEAVRPSAASKFLQNRLSRERTQTGRGEKAAAPGFVPGIEREAAQLLNSPSRFPSGGSGAEGLVGNRAPGPTWGISAATEIGNQTLRLTAMKPSITAHRIGFRTTWGRRPRRER